MFKVENWIAGLKSLVQNVDVKRFKNMINVYKEYVNWDDEEEENRERVKVASIAISDLESISKRVSNDYISDNLCLIKNKRLEVAIVDKSRKLLGSSNEQFTFNEYGISGELSKASEDYVYFFISKCLDNPSYHRMLLISHDKIVSSNLVDIGKQLRLKTLIINTEYESNSKHLNKLMNSYLFNIAYNYDYSINLLDLNIDKVMRFRKKQKGQLVPLREYDMNLVNYYNHGISTDMPFTQYLAFYHVIENFFQSISEEETFSEIKRLITRPSFSPYIQKDVKEFYNKVRKLMKDQREDGVWDEKTGLLLTLKKYIIDFENLKNAIITIQPNAIDYYKNNNVSFAYNASTIDFSLNRDEIYTQLRNRIYAVRNSLVHSKEGDKLRYQPFINDKQLSLEIPLIRAVAEEIIISTSKPIINK